MTFNDVFFPDGITILVNKQLLVLWCLITKSALLASVFLSV